MPSGDDYRQATFNEQQQQQQQQQRATANAASDASARTAAANASADASFAWAVMQDVQASHANGGGGAGNGNGNDAAQPRGSTDSSAAVNNANAVTLGEYLQQQQHQQQQQRSSKETYNDAAYHPGHYDLGPATGSSLHAQREEQGGDSLWARRLKSTNIKLEESHNVSPSKSDYYAATMDRTQSAPRSNEGDHNSVEAQQAAMAFIMRGALAYSQNVVSSASAAGNASGRQRQVGGWTGESSNATSTQQQLQEQQRQQEQQQSQQQHQQHLQQQSQQLQQQLELGMAALARQRQNSCGSTHTFDEQQFSSSSSDGSSDHPLLRLSPSQLSTNRPEFAGTAMQNLATAGGSQWQLPNGMPPPSWPGMSPQAYGGNAQSQLSAGFGGGMSAFEHDNAMSGMMDPRCNPQSFSFDSSTLARSDSGTGTLSNSGATTLSTIFDESSPGSSSNANTTPSSAMTSSSGPSTGQSLEASAAPEPRIQNSNANNGKAVVHSSKAKVTRQQKPRGQHKPQSAQSVSDGFTSSSSNAASEPVEGKSRRTSTIDSLGRYVCPHAGCDKTFSTSGHARRHAHTHTTQTPFVCPHEGCDATFSRRDNCTQHQRTRHNHVVEAYRLGAEQAASPEQSIGAESS